MRVSRAFGWRTELRAQSLLDAKPLDPPPRGVHIVFVVLIAVGLRAISRLDDDYDNEEEAETTADC